MLSDVCYIFLTILTVAPSRALSEETRRWIHHAADLQPGHRCRYHHRCFLISTHATFNLRYRDRHVMFSDVARGRSEVLGLKRTKGEYRWMKGVNACSPLWPGSW